MEVAEDIRTVDELKRDPEQLINRANQNRRPMMITVDGRPAALLISTELFPSKQIALNAACELVDAGA